MHSTDSQLKKLIQKHAMRKFSSHIDITTHITSEKRFFISDNILFFKVNELK